MNTQQIVKLVEEVSVQMADADASIAALTGILGQVTERYSGSGYYLAPRHAGLARVWVGIREQPGRGEVLTDVELDLAPGSPLKALDLTRSFGVYRRVPAAPSGPLHRVSWKRDDGAASYVITVFATLSDDPDRPDTLVQSIALRRDAR